MESGIEPNVDLDSLDERIKIREMILKGQIQDAIALINSLHPELLDTNRYLYFHLQVILIAVRLAIKCFAVDPSTVGVCHMVSISIVWHWVIGMHIQYT